MIVIGYGVSRFEKTKLDKFLPERENLKWNNDEPTRVGPIFTKYTLFQYVFWLQAF